MCVYICLHDICGKLQNKFKRSSINVKYQIHDIAYNLISFCNTHFHEFKCALCNVNSNA